MLQLPIDAEQGTTHAGENKFFSLFDTHTLPHADTHGVNSVPCYLLGQWNICIPLSLCIFGLDARLNCSWPRGFSLHPQPAASYKSCFGAFIPPPRPLACPACSNSSRLPAAFLYAFVGAAKQELGLANTLANSLCDWIASRGLAVRPELRSWKGGLEVRRANCSSSRFNSSKVFLVVARGW